MAFTGAWRASAGAYTQPEQGVTHVSDPAHAVVGPDEGVNVYTYQTPAVTDPGDVAEYPGMEWIAQTSGRVIDTTDYDNHGRDDSPHGADVDRNYGEPSTQFFNEHYSGARFEGLAGQDINPVALQRGRNGLTENNPDGFRRGWQEQSFVDRKFAVAQERVHDHRVIFPNTASFAPDAPALAGGAYPTTSTLLARAITDITQSPEARRPPPAIGQDQIGDGSPYDYATSESWVVG
jgi:hypothetical protein